MTAPVSQRDEARQTREHELEDAAKRLKAVRQKGEARWEQEREAFEAKWKEAEELRGLLGTAENERDALEKRLRAAIARLDDLEAKRTFPRGRIYVHQRDCVRTEEGEPFLIFGVKVSNWETSRSMNLELEFVLRSKARLARGYPILK